MLISTQETLIYKSISPEDIYCYTPGITVTSTGRLVVTFDLGGKGGKRNLCFFAVVHGKDKTVRYR